MSAIDHDVSGKLPRGRHTHGDEPDMNAIDHKATGGILSPLKGLQFFGRKPVTQPLEPRPASANYRGFHLNDWQLCIGCSTCQKVCDNAAITMVEIPGLPEDAAKGVRNLRPAIDYGRCCWCALCVDLCPTGSISLSREYVHTCTDPEIDSYFVLPDANGIHGVAYDKGWAKSEQSDLVALQRTEMPEMAPEARIANFDEIVEGYDKNQGIIEASRCVQCGMCHDACPTHMNAPEYIRAIWQDDIEEAVRQIYRTNPFAHTCGRVCTHRCETACSVGHRGAPIAIRWLKRFAMDQLDHERVKEIAAEGKAAYPSGKRVAIIGAGPAGLTAAYDLAKQGHAVKVFEAMGAAGGMTRYGIPYYRLPADKLDQDVDVITSLGVEIQYDTRIGSDVTMERLRDDYDAVLVAVGLWMGRSTRVKGAEADGVYRAVELLRKVADGESIPVPKQAVIIGGGNVAMDIARTLARLQKQHYGQVAITLTALEDLDHFLADPDEIKEAREEGVEILDARGPQEVVLDSSGRATGLRTWKVLSIFDEQGRFAPKYDETDEIIHAGDMVVEAIGQAADVNLLGEALTEALEWNRGRLKVDEQLRTSADWLWAAGDMVRGPDVVSAVADGHRAAASINDHLSIREQAA
ncbi:MAG: FAD-dependent oxidoreductase [Thiohalocapsa sp.]|jgi:glutamate synthase (NADPH/NADH) small chain|uniref:FAD-dependent oxidoreductase n=1 Tax=Thiohalocapsa sp. TaxID=2497641 RepID=UPI0025FAE236|nr:FAD-dependent oxidoreductase [Thiohalocapsa sp.]MCG6940515.1 FAD-dependent oxidoreductase [Thiohalocapsa sp.]